MSEEVNIDDILVMLRSAESDLDALKVLIDAIEAKLDVPDNFKADVSALSTAAALTTHDTEVKALVNNIFDRDTIPLYRTYPKLANPVTVATGVAAWAEGSWIEIIPANTIATAFWIVGFYWNCSVYHSILELGAGAEGSEIQILNIPKTIVFSTAHGAVVHSPDFLPLLVRIPANTRISARTADAHTASSNHEVKVIYALGL